MKFKRIIPILFSGLTIMACRHIPEEVPQKLEVTLEPLWTSDTSLRVPESALYHPSSNVIYVSNINGFNPSIPDGDGFISKLNPDGTTNELHWVKGLNDPKGLCIFKNSLFVADIKELKEIDLTTGAVINIYSSPKAVFLNDVAVDKKGKVFVSDNESGIIFTILGDSLSIVKEYAGANGLLLEEGKILAASISTGNVDFINGQGNLTPLTTGIANADGIGKDSYSNFLISNWDGEVYYVKRNGEKTVILDTKAQGYSAADIDVIPGSNTLLVPTFFTNTIAAYKIKYKLK